MSAAYAAVLDSLGRVAGDPGEAIYAELFAQHPETEALFFLDRTGSHRAQMLTRTFETLLDYVGDRSFARGMLETEQINHQELGVDPATFARFFAIVRDALRRILGPEWTDAHEAGWAELLAELDALLGLPA